MNKIDLNKSNAVITGGAQGIGFASQNVLLNQELLFAYGI